MTKKLTIPTLTAFSVLLICSSVLAQTAPSMRIVLPERTRLLQGQLVDLVLEIRNASSISSLKVTAGSVDITSNFSTPQAAQLDCDATADMVVRANLQSFENPGSVVLRAEATAGGTTVSDSRTIEVRPFTPSGRRNVILFIG